MNKPDENDEKILVSADNNDNDDDVKSWAEEAKQDLEDFIESQGIYIRQ